MKLKHIKRAGCYVVTRMTELKGKQHFEQNFFSTEKEAKQFIKEQEAKCLEQQKS
jgi:hypothetical protein